MHRRQVVGDQVTGAAGGTGHGRRDWVFVTGATTVFVMDTSRSAVPAAASLDIDRGQTALETGRTVRGPFSRSATC
jgi:hypothetical protein